jgi:hypothetical protein
MIGKKDDAVEEEEEGKREYRGSLLWIDQRLGVLSSRSISVW